MDISNYTWEIWIVGMLLVFCAVLVKKVCLNSSAGVISKTERLFLYCGLTVCAIAVAIAVAIFGFDYGYDFATFIS